MPRAESPEQMEVAIHYAAYPTGERRVEFATEFIVIYKDQFGTPLICGQNVDDLQQLLHPRVQIETTLAEE